MTKRIEPGLFARLMRMSPEPRRDLLEFLGQSPVDAEDIVLVAETSKERKPQIPESRAR